MYSDEDIARVAHEAVRALQAIHGDSCPAPWWDSAPAWMRESSIDTVRMARNGATPRQLHERWCDEKWVAGWSYGPVKDAEKLTHPCLVPYDQLPDHQKDKDALFSAIVLAMALRSVAG